MRIVFSLVLTVLNRHANHYLLLLILVNLQFSCVFLLHFAAVSSCIVYQWCRDDCFKSEVNDEHCK